MNSSADEFIYSEDPRADEWPEAYAPREGKDVIVFKNKPSCFFETPLESWLRYDRIDTLIVVGVSMETPTTIKVSIRS